MSIMTIDKVKMNATAKDKYEAIRMAGQILLDARHISSEYIDKMLNARRSCPPISGTGWLFHMAPRNPRYLFNPQASPSFSFRKA